MTSIKTTTDTTTWQIDPVHSKITFAVEHMVISKVVGFFRKFEGKVITEDENFETAQVEVAADAASIDTNNEQRDNHLRSHEFIDAAKFPKIIFKSTSVKKINDNSYILSGDFTLRGVTRQIELNVKYNGSITDPYNNKRAGFQISAEINRKDFGVSWHAALDFGGLVAGDTVDITAFIEIMHQ